MLYYFAYGSNLHPVRLMERVPSAQLIGVAKHANHSLSFHKRSHDGSGKCNMHHSGSGHVYGAIYSLDPNHKSALDKFEGKGFGYIDVEVLLQHEGMEYACFTYIAQESHIIDGLNPYGWYKRLVALGAKYLGFPDSYLSAIEAVESIDDPDKTRKKEKEMLIDRIIRDRLPPAVEDASRW